MSTCKLDLEPLSVFATMAESDFQMLHDGTDQPILNLLEKSAYPNPVPDTVINTDPDNGEFVMRMEDTRTLSKLIEAFPVVEKEEAR